MDWRAEGLHVLGPDEIDDIDTAFRHLQRAGDIDLHEITPLNFPLRSALARYLTSLEHNLRFGHGFSMLRGIPREKYSADDMARIYFGLGSYIGKPLTQSYQGDLLGHVIDVSDVEADARTYHAGGAIAMHSDSCDIVGLMCVRSAKLGGLSRISSAVAVHNAIIERRPDLIDALYRGFYYKRTATDAAHATCALSPYRVPTFAENSGEVSSYFLGVYARRADRHGDAKLTPLEIEAIAEVEKLAASEEFFLDMNFTEGDVQFLNNRTMLHARTDYADEKEVYRRRHLLRLWLEIPAWPRLPTHQIFHTNEDRRLWARSRKRLMELPSAYLADIAGRVALAH